MDWQPALVPNRPERQIDDRLGGLRLSSVSMPVKVAARLCLAVGLFVSSGGPVRAAELKWPQFRGPGGSGVGDSDFPTHFGPGSNVLWKATLPAGHSSPCVWGGHIFLTGFADGKLETLCLDRRNGVVLWRRHLEPGNMERGAQLSHPATATPTTDGDRVCVYFGAFGLVAYDFAGAELWRKALPVPVTQHGAGTSPVLAGDRLILNCDQDVGSYLLAVDKRDGRTVWKTLRPGFLRGFATPLPWPADQPEQLIVPGTLRLVAYGLNDGLERWGVRGLPNEMVSSPVTGDGLIYVAGWTYGSGVGRMPDFGKLFEQGDANQDGELTREEAPAGPARQHFAYLDADKNGRVSRAEYATIARAFDESKNVALAVRPDGHGDVTDTHVAWRATRGLPYVPSPLYYEGRIYLVKNGGLASCLDARSGRMLYQEERLGTLGDYYCSPVAAAGKICVASQPGVVVIYRAGDILEVLARNALDEPIVATPAVVEGTLYVRTASQLYAFRAKDDSVQPRPPAPPVPATSTSP